MLKKTSTKSGATTKVTFELPAEAAGSEVFLVGDFNDWARDSTPLTRRKDGRYSVTLTLQSGKRYRYRYLVDGARWENDWAADAYERNEFGGEDSILEI